MATLRPSSAISTYRHRHCARTGISGLALASLDYIKRPDATRGKVQKAPICIRRAGFLPGTWIRHLDRLDGCSDGLRRGARNGF